MLRPEFVFSQSVSAVCVEVRAARTRASEVALHVDDEGRVLRVLCPPWALALRLAGPVCDQDTQASAEYCQDSGLLTVRLPKKTPGQHFAEPEVVREERWWEGEGEQKEREEKEEAEAEAVAEAREKAPPVYYGFNNHYTDVFRGLEDYDILELGDPEGVLPEERQIMRMAAEETKFDGDYYIGDLLNSEDYAHVISFRPYWMDFVVPKVVDMSIETTLAAGPSLSEQDSILLARLGPRSFMLENEQATIFGLVDILFAYAHHELSNNGEQSCEGSWSVSRLSPLLSWLDMSCCKSGLSSVLVTSYRRALCYPLYRSWQLCTTVHRHVANILRGGIKVVLKCLLQVHHIFTHNDEKRYLINLVLIDDYIRWIQTVPAVLLLQLADAVEKTQVSKESVDLNLDALEKLAKEEEDNHQENYMMEVEEY